ncbi:Kynurenine formamidase [Puccinia graminis f. sp. tritici]|uniref:Kynurenine formamidase n=1 Tax=Puccinia graminis f. sp. tritici TaxID=56615 RepID=A0A5B0Q9H8_PUCGR|nr:Kynurenine formamidase [Puccinia graminis f. sp. tritici]
MTVNHRLLDSLTYPGGIPPYQCLDVYIPLAAPPKLTQLVTYVHGGAWRAGDKADRHSVGLIGNLSSQFPTAAICSVNYRLSTGKVNPESDVKHPTHNADVARAIEHVKTLPELKDIDETYLIGHSVGAFICLSLAGILEPPSPEAPRLAPSTCKNIRGLILLDGIYDLVKLLEEYPSYNDFVAGAFQEKDIDRLTYLEDVSPLSWSSSTVNPTTCPRILILHSRQDSLLTIRQSELAAIILESKLSLGNKLESDFESVSGDHDDLLLSPELASRIKSFIAGSK